MIAPPLYSKILITNKDQFQAEINKVLLKKLEKEIQNGARFVLSNGREVFGRTSELFVEVSNFEEVILFSNIVVIFFLFFVNKAIKFHEE